MAVATTGVNKSGPRKGWHWQIYPDPASRTGWTRKEFDPYDTSNGGRPVEYFGDYNYAAAQVDADELSADEAKAEAKRQQKAREKAESEQRVQAALDKDVKAKTDEANAKARERDYEEDRVYQDKDKAREATAALSRADNDARMRELEKRLANDRREFDLQYGLDREKLGVDRDRLGADILKTAASMRGPLDYFQGASYARGAGTSGLTPYLGAFAQGQVPAYGGGTATRGNPTPLTVGGLVGEMTGRGTGGGVPQGLDAYGRPLLRSDQQSALDVIDKKFQGGLANAKQGEFENLTDNELKAFTSGGDYLGRDTASEFQFWKRSRPGQGSAMAG